MMQKRKHIFLIIFLILWACQQRENERIEAAGLERLLNRTSSSGMYRPQQIIAISDSALAIIRKLGIADSLKVKWLELKANTMVSIDLRDSVITMLNNERQQALETGNPEVVIFTNLLLGEYYLDEGKNKLAGKCIRNAMLLIDSTSNEYQVARANNLMGTLLRTEGNYEEAQYHFLRALELFEKNGDLRAVGSVSNNIAMNYEAIGDISKARKYLKKAFEISIAQNDTFNIISSANNLGVFYRPQNSDSAMYYFNFCLVQSDKPDFLVQLLPLKFNLGNLYLDRKDYDTASRLFREVLHICKEKGIQAGIARSYNAIAGIYEARNENDSAMKYYQMAYAIADSSGEKPIAVVFLDNLRYMYMKTGNCEKSQELAEKYHAERDSLFALEKQVAVHELEMLYSAEKAEKENQQLSNSVRTMKARIKSIYVILALGLFFLIVASFAVAFIYKLYKQRDIAYNTLFEQFKSNPLSEKLIGNLDQSISKYSRLGKGSTNPTMDLILEYMEKEKPFTDCNLSLIDFSRKLNLPPKVISNEIFQISGMHFSSFVNSYRVIEVLKLLSLPESRNYKIETLAMQAGFGSRAAFYSAFIKATGSKPSDYRTEDA